MHSNKQDNTLLSICMTCRDGREDFFDGVRGGARFAEKIYASLTRDDHQTLSLRGVHCMSQCKRSCTISLTAPDAFTWIFGDLDPEHHAADVIAIARLYQSRPNGFMARDERPEPMRAGVLGRLPPIGSTHEIIELLDPSLATPPEPLP